MTYLEAVNAVLLRMREGVVASVSQTDYSMMIGELVKQAVTEIETRWKWLSLRSTIQIVTSAGKFDYELTGAGNSHEVLQVFEDTEDYRLEKPPSYEKMNRWLLNNNPAVDFPRYWDKNGTSNGHPVVNFYPIPDQPYAINFNLVINSVLDEDADEILVPSLPVILRSQQLAVLERGEDVGMDEAKLGLMTEKALGDAIVLDGNMYENETEWEVE